MKRFSIICIVMVLFSLSAFAQDAELNIRLDSIRDLRSTYTSVIDLYELNLLTPSSAELEKEYRNLMSRRRSESANGLFYEEQILLSESEQIQARAIELGLFSKGQEDVFYRPPVIAEETQQNYPLYAIIIATLCITGFLFSNSRYKRKRKERGDVHHSDNAFAGE